MMHNSARLRSRSSMRSTPSSAVAVSRKFSRLDWICWAARVSVKWVILFIFLLGLGWADNAGFSRVWYTFYPDHHLGNVNLDTVASESQIAEVQNLFKRTTNMFQVQLELLNIKFNKEVDSVKRELEARMKDHAYEFHSELKRLKDSNTEIEEVFKRIKESEMLTRHDVHTIVNEVFEDRAARGDGSVLSLDDVGAVARQLIESEIKRHAADGLGMVDFAVRSSGSKVVRHSEPYFAKMSGWCMAAWVVKIGGLHPHASKVLEPSFGEPGQCLPLKGSKGFVDIALRSSILVSAVTLEHVAKSVAFDRSSAPKDFRILGWNDEEESSQTSVLGMFVEFQRLTYEVCHNKCSILANFFPFLLVALAFRTFVLYNGSVLLGAKDAHVVSPHFAQVLYFGLAAATGMAPLHFNYVQLLVLFQSLKEGRLSFIFKGLFVSCIAVLAVHYFSLAHPYLLADNRHYTFYVWRKVLQRHWSVKYLLIPLYLYSWWSIVMLLDRMCRKIWTLVFCLATSAVVAPAPLIEFRYYTVPFYFIVLHAQATKFQWAINGLIYTVINSLSIYLFLFKPFHWAHESGIQRFMW